MRPTRRLALCALLPMLARGAAMAQTAPANLTPDQKGYIVYDRCMLDAAVKASYTSAPDQEIFRLAKVACADTRVAVTTGQQDNKAYIAALDAADADKAKNFPAWIKGVRERRRQREAQSAKP